MQTGGVQMESWIIVLIALFSGVILGFILARLGARL